MIMVCGPRAGEKDILADHTASSNAPGLANYLLSELFIASTYSSI